MDALDRILAANRTDADWLEHMKQAGPPGWEWEAPIAPGGSWFATAPNGDAVAAWSPSELLDEAREIAAARERRNIRDERGNGKGQSW